MQAHPFTAQRPLFKAYDIRGDKRLFTNEFITALSQSLACHFLSYDNVATIVLGYDTRHGSREIAVQLADSFVQHDIEVVWLGMVTTPIMAFWANKYQGHGLIATASHSERHINGIKWLIEGESPSSESIQSIYNHLPTIIEKASSNPFTSNKFISLDPQLVTETYINEAAKAVNNLNSQLYQANSNLRKSNTPLKIVIDCLNGSTGPFATQFFDSHSNMCHQIIMLNDIPNPDFPKGNPDPMEDNRLQELGKAVVHHQANIGLSFDGDGDRLMVVDNFGKALAPDYLLYLLARIAVEDYRLNHSNDSHNPTKYLNTDFIPTIVFDVKCSHHLPQLIEKIGAKGQMCKTGSSLLRKALRNESQDQQDPILFAGELSGHFIFNDGHFMAHDDAMYAGLRFINWLSHYPNALDTKEPIALTDIISGLPPMVSTSDVYLPLSAYQSQDSFDTSVSQIKNLHPILRKLANMCLKLQSGSLSLPMFQKNDMRLTCIDGIRLDFKHGFGIIRSSNTSNSLTVRFAADSMADLEKIQSYFVELCLSISKDLACQVAKIGIKK